MAMGKLILVRHHESEWNKKGLWTGIRNIRLTPYGFEKSAEMGLLLNDVHFDHAFASMQVRTIETLACMLDAQCRYNVPTDHIKAINERDYGDYTGKNKWDMEKLLGKEEFNKLRRSWNYPIPNGETLKMVYERVIPFFMNTVLPMLRDSKNILIVSHGNALRAMIKYIEKIPDDKIGDVEMPFGAVLIYDLDNDGRLISKEKREIPSVVPA
jgi:2,3-bisphosphoglycerate-dependent phosphoglycerate mutase